MSGRDEEIGKSVADGQKRREASHSDHAVSRAQWCQAQRSACSNSISLGWTVPKV